ncbi:MAG TPA: hypothetical protein VLJ39_07725 [Tepidisphaeraceae bacterium]|nr:hypothetical protein [Tepidisphaeraceae bacterium]
MSLNRWMRMWQVVAVLAVGVPAMARGRMIFPGGGAVGGGMVSLPYAVQDNGGNNYRIYQGGWFQQNNNMPLYSQGAMLTIDGQNPGANANTAKLDPKTGEVVLENLSGAGCSVTRYILVDKPAGYIRYIDVIKNTGSAPKAFQIMVQSTCNYGINAGSNVTDPKKKDQAIGWVGETGANQSVVEMFAGKGAKVVPQISWPQGNNVVQATISLTIPAGKQQAIMHMHTVAPTQDAGTRFITDLKEAPILKSIPPQIRRIIVNFRSAQDFIGDLEVLRGDMLDVVELRGGDSFKGTLQEKGFDLQTFYGDLALPVDKVVALINVGQFKPRQLIVTNDGQIIGGFLKKQTIELQMSSGQVTQIPLSQINRMGYRKRPGEAEEWTFEKPMVLMRTGERMVVQMPQEPIDIVTRYGKLSLKPEQVAAVQLQNEDNNVHEIELTDGSRFAGLLTADSFTMRLDTGATPQEVKFPVSGMTRLQLTPKVNEPTEITPIIRLSNDDQMVGSLTGKLHLATAFDTIDINAPELKTLGHVTDGGAQDVQVSLWDGTTFSGQLQEQDVTCNLLSGVTVKVPVALVQAYTQPQPQPSQATVERIKNIVQNDLTNDDYKVREHARTELLAMGSAVASVLKQFRENQPPEAQKSIDVILNELEKQQKPPKPAATQ